MPITTVNKIKSTISPNQHPYLNGAWTPNHEEVNATDLEIIGEVPSDIDGVYIRNTENQIHEAIGRYHPFDGDGMIHAMRFTDGKAEYRNRFVKTKGFLAEQKAQKSLWTGLMEIPPESQRSGWGAHGGLKDSSSTDVIVHAGKILSTFYQCGEGYRLDPYSLENLGTESWVPDLGISAHPRLDEATGELLFFNYSKTPPFMHYGVVGHDNKLKHLMPVELPGPRLPHDMAFTENYAILNDFPLFWDPELMKRGVHATRFFKDLPSRFAIIPRLGGTSEVRWFEAEPTFVLHWVNAYEKDDEVILDGYFQESPDPPRYADAPRGYERMMAFLDQQLLKPKLHRWRFNLKTGQTVEERLDDQILEFGTINHRFGGKRHRYAYSAIPTPGWFMFDGLKKNDLELGHQKSLLFGKGRFGSEPAFAPRVNWQTEDDGYLISFVTDMEMDRSECIVVDAADLEAGPICRIILPMRISSGTHATWAHGSDIKAAAKWDS